MPYKPKIDAKTGKPVKKMKKKPWSMAAKAKRVGGGLKGGKPKKTPYGALTPRKKPKFKNPPKFKKPKAGGGLARPKPKKRKLKKKGYTA